MMEKSPRGQKNRSEIISSAVFLSTLLLINIKEFSNVWLPRLNQRLMALLLVCQRKCTEYETQYKTLKLSREQKNVSEFSKVWYY